MTMTIEPTAPENYRELLLGCGRMRKKLIGPKSQGDEPSWRNLITLDLDPNCNPDLICDLDREHWYGAPLSDAGRSALSTEAITAGNHLRYRLRADYFDEVHAYDLLENLGQQGMPKSFFWTFAEIHRILKPRGLLFATATSRYSPWLWGDPGHRRVIFKESLLFLDQHKIRDNRARGTPLTDYSHLWWEDFEIIAAEDNHVRHIFTLRAHKPSRPNA